MFDPWSFITGGLNLLGSGNMLFPGAATLITGGAQVAEGVQNTVEEYGDDVQNWVGRITIIILGFIFIAAGLLMFRGPSTVVVDGDGGSE